MGGTIEKVMVYIDGTEQSIAAAKCAICLAKETDAQLLAVYVVNTRALVDLVHAHIFLESERQAYLRDLENDALRYLNHVRELASRKGLFVETLQRSGSVHQEIKSLVEEYAVDLLVIGELPRLQSRRDELYDETERAMRRVGCSVLIVKDQERVERLFETLP